MAFAVPAEAAVNVLGILRPGAVTWLESGVEDHKLEAALLPLGAPRALCALYLL